MPSITIAGRRIGPGHAPFIIAECGINDGGESERARALCEEAAGAGVDAVKWQQHCRQESSERQPWQDYRTAAEAPTVWLAGTGVAYGLTVFSAHVKENMHTRTGEDPLDAWNLATARLDYLKIGSGEVSNHQLIAAVAMDAQRRDIPVLLSTGMHTLDEVDAAVAILREHTVPFAVLECTSTYPARHGEVRLAALADLRERYPDAVIGISDHTPDIWTALGAVALGACIVEKHFTVSRGWGGPDNPFSIEPDEMAKLCAGARAIHAAMSSGGHRVSEAEAETARWARHGVYATRDIKPGEQLTEQSVTCRRPLPPSPCMPMDCHPGKPHTVSGLAWPMVLSMKAPRAFARGEAIQFDTRLAGDGVAMTGTGVA